MKNINKLESLFWTSVEQITHRKLTLLAIEKMNKDMQIAITPDDPLLELLRVLLQSQKELCIILMFY